MSWKVYDKTGQTVRCEVKELEYNGTWMGECFVTADIQSATPLPFSIGDYLTYRGERFEINYDPSVIKKARTGSTGDAFTYEGVKFNSLSDELTRCMFLDYVKSDNQIHYSSLPKFSFFASTVDALAERIQVNLDRIYTGDRKWTVTVHPDFSGKTDVNVQADNLSTWDALGLANSKFGANFIIRGRTVTIGTAGIAADNIFKHGKGNGLYELERVADTDQAVVTRLRVYGSTRNMPARYYNKLSGADGTKLVPDNMAVENLMLPDFPKVSLDPYLDSDNISALGIREQSVYFDGSSEDFPEICPSMEGMTADDLRAAGVQTSATGALDEIVSAGQVEDDGLPDDDGETDIPTFTVTLKDIGFDINDYLTEQTACISMKSGMCAGREFEIADCEKQGSNYVLTCNRVYDEAIGLFFPYSGYNLNGGDKFVLLYIEMPDVYIQSASQRLKAAGEEWLGKNDHVRYSYSPKVDEIYMARQHEEAMASGGLTASLHDTLKEGDIFLFEDESLGISGSVTIDVLTIREGEGVIPTYEVTLRDEKSVGTLERIQNQLDSIVNGNGAGGGGYNAEQIRSLIRTFGGQYFLSKTKVDQTNFLLKFGEFIDSMVAGKGAGIFPDGRGQFERLQVRGGLEVLEIIFNRQTAMEGDYSFSESGTIETVTAMGDGSYTLQMRKRWENDFTALREHDVIYGVVNDLAQGGGSYYTSWMRVLSVNTAANTLNVVAYPDGEVPGGLNHAPEPLMVVTRRGNPVDETRQRWWYISSTEGRLVMLDGVTKPILEEENYSVILGELPPLGMFDNLPEEYTKYNTLYVRGILTNAVKVIDFPEELPRVANDRGEWSLATAQGDEPYNAGQEKDLGTMMAEVYDTVWHYGCQWMCLVTGTTDEPRYASTGWAMIQGNPEFTVDIDSSNGWHFDADKFATTLTVAGKLYNQDVTSSILDEDVTWTRDTGDVTEDNAWATAHAEAGKSLPLTVEDLGPDYMQLTGCKFIVQVLLRDGQTARWAEDEVSF